jgi:AbrB family looped-hinge helix DNA binding protein
MNRFRCCDETLQRAKKVHFGARRQLDILAMTEQVLVTRRGQTTIPARIRKKLGIREGTKLEVEIIDNKVVFSKAPSISDLDGKSKLSREQAFRLLDKMRLEEE